MAGEESGQCVGGSGQCVEGGSELKFSPLQCVGILQSVKSVCGDCCVSVSVWGSGQCMGALVSVWGPWSVCWNSGQCMGTLVSVWMLWSVCWDSGQGVGALVSVWGLWSVCAGSGQCVEGSGQCVRALLSDCSVWPLYKCASCRGQYNYSVHYNLSVQVPVSLPVLYNVLLVWSVYYYSSGTFIQQRCILSR